MSTNSSISIKKGNKIKTIYCHWDGDYNGEVLLASYKTAKKVEELINLGDISSLHSRVKPLKVGKVQKKVDGKRQRDENGKYILITTKVPHSFDNPHYDTTVAYGRDRGEEGGSAREYTGDVEENYEFNYLFENNKWFIRSVDRPKWVELTKKMCS